MVVSGGEKEEEVGERTRKSERRVVGGSEKEWVLPACETEKESRRTDVDASAVHMV